MRSGRWERFVCFSVRQLSQQIIKVAKQAKWKHILPDKHNLSPSAVQLQTPQMFESSDSVAIAIAGICLRFPILSSDVPSLLRSFSTGLGKPSLYEPCLCTRVQSWWNISIPVKGNINVTASEDILDYCVLSALRQQACIVTCPREVHRSVHASL